MKVIYCGDYGFRWSGLYVLASDFESIQNLTGDDYEQARFDLFDRGFSLNSSIHKVVEID